MVDGDVVGVVVVAFGVEKEDKTEDDGDRDNGKGIGSYCDVSEKVCGCILAHYQSCFLTLIPSRIHLTLPSVAVFEIVNLIAVTIWI